MEALVDIDNILWDFAEELTRRMRVLFPDKVIVKNPSFWDYPRQFFASEDQAKDMFYGIHMDQEKFIPFPGASDLIQELVSSGYDIHIASNRSPETMKQLLNWLWVNDIPASQVYCGEDKRKLFRVGQDHNIGLVIDDSPEVQVAAIEQDIEVFTLEYRYNRGKDGIHYFNNLFDMQQALADRREKKISLV